MHKISAMLGATDNQDRLRSLLSLLFPGLVPEFVPGVFEVPGIIFFAVQHVPLQWDSRPHPRRNNTWHTPSSWPTA